MLNEVYKKYKENPTDENKDIFGAELMKYCVKMVKTKFAGRRDIDDMVMDACLLVWKDLDQYKGTSTFSTWVGSVLIHMGVAEASAQDKYEEVPLEENSAVYNPYHGINAKLDLKSLLSTLSERDKSFIKLKLEGYTDDELDVHFEKKSGWAEVRYQRIVKNLQKSVSNPENLPIN